MLCRLFLQCGKLFFEFFLFSLVLWEKIVYACACKPAECAILVQPAYDFINLLKPFPYGLRWSSIFVTLTRKNLWFICITVSFFKRCPVTITRMWTYMVIPHIRIFSDCFIQKLIICKLVLSYQLPIWHLCDGCFGSQLPICRINPLCCSYTSFLLLLNISM